MSRIDQLTGRGPIFGQTRSHSNVASKSRQNLNLQKIKIGGVRVRVSARTIKTLKKIARQMKGEMPTLKQKKAAKRVATLKSK